MSFITWKSFFCVFDFSACINDQWGRPIILRLLLPQKTQSRWYSSNKPNIYQVDMRAKCSFMYFFYCRHCFLQDNIGNRTLCDISCESTRLGQFYTGKPTINKTRPRKHLSHSSLLIKRDYFLTHASCKSKNI